MTLKLKGGNTKALIAESIIIIIIIIKHNSARQTGGGVCVYYRNHFEVSRITPTGIMSYFCRIFN